MGLLGHILSVCYTLFFIIFFFMLHFKEKSQTTFQSGCTILHFTQQYVSIPAASYPCKPLAWSVFFILTGMPWYFIVVLIGIFLKNNNV